MTIRFGVEYQYTVGRNEETTMASRSRATSRIPTSARRFKRAGRPSDVSLEDEYDVPHNDKRRVEFRETMERIASAEKEAVAASRDLNL